MDIISLRAAGVWSDETYGYIKNKRRENPEFEWSPYWKYGAFIAVRNIAALSAIASTSLLEIPTIAGLVFSANTGFNVFPS